MVDKMLKCRVCGKLYEACLSKRVGTTFRWQDVGCSPECGAEYLRRIQVSRGLISDESVVSSITSDSDELVDGFDDTDLDSELNNEFDSDDFGE